MHALTSFESSSLKHDASDQSLQTVAGDLTKNDWDSAMEAPRSQYISITYEVYQMNKKRDSPTSIWVLQRLLWSIS
ncbi:MAG: hypothetical protein CMQ45_08285 [Gammaproteobacteria bacterium]|nr:hypothetical protein [Gammaproteobacteria bacterium]